MKLIWLDLTFPSLVIYISMYLSCQGIMSTFMIHNNTKFEYGSKSTVSIYRNQRYTTINKLQCYISGLTIWSLVCKFCSKIKMRLWHFNLGLPKVHQNLGYCQDRLASVWVSSSRGKLVGQLVGLLQKLLREPRKNSEVERNWFRLKL